MSEPVAWKVDQLVFSAFSSAEHHANIVNIPITPLYEHPMRELTEDEIKEVADSVCHAWKKNGVGEIYMTDFARAILKKASEK